MNSAPPRFTRLLPSPGIRGARPRGFQGRMRATAMRGTLHIVLPPSRSRRLVRLHASHRPGANRLWERLVDDRKLGGFKILLLAGLILLAAALEWVV